MGLSSRFDKVLRFEDYSPDELNEIAVSMIHQQDMRITPKALEHLTGYFRFLYDYRDKYFGNARTIRQVIQDVIKNQNLRLAKGGPDVRNQVNLITFEDVKDFAKDKNLQHFQRQSIGYKK